MSQQGDAHHGRGHSRDEQRDDHADGPALSSERRSAAGPQVYTARPDGELTALSCIVV
ncbi:hypothetical protein PYK79_34335 [Streptomyces sp. ID05-04B]|uniref:hypothetical protein n=1 Tax=unclassified Streptomyces TaxID=2593676 RepID=UPI00131F4018|nr:MULTISPECIES: hypothetical protein [unclassified Streptomyces]MDX5567340.1 hypothetical protein [Streptomyces sp. ID05-04B]